ncbi:MAG TPA: hypothetical protein PKD17_08665 [Cellvibrionaceae bacterium]|nr:hypothetical protein [Cellvibrionaceae bacterium]HMW71877.1 hypothetical protein [Cellvibrionaceae bacterium]HMY41004.1 hypothetical protein [Marinagarivorans sp.]HNG59091.1 hypothetical protein [Cellvibrionaceae bacterium]
MMDNDDIWITYSEKSNSSIVVGTQIFVSLMLLVAIAKIGALPSAKGWALVISLPLIWLFLLNLSGTQYTAVNFIVHNIVEDRTLFGSVCTRLISFSDITFFAYDPVNGHNRLKIILRSGKTHFFNFGNILSPRYQRLISAIDASNPNPYRSAVQLDDASVACLQIAPIHFTPDQITLDVKNQKIIVGGKPETVPVEIRFSDISNVIVLIDVDSDPADETKTFNRYCLCAILNSFEKIELTDYETDRQGDEVRDKMWAARLHVNAYLERAHGKRVTRSDFWDCVGP